MFIVKDNLAFVPNSEVLTNVSWISSKNTTVLHNHSFTYYVLSGNGCFSSIQCTFSHFNLINCFNFPVLTWSVSSNTFSLCLPQFFLSFWVSMWLSSSITSSFHNMPKESWLSFPYGFNYDLNVLQLLWVCLSRHPRFMLHFLPKPRSCCFWFPLNLFLFSFQVS